MNGHKDLLRSFKNVIAMHGIAVVAIPGSQEGPPFAYTIGFTDIGLPEVFVMGLPASSVAGPFNEYYADIKSGKVIPGAGQTPDYYNMPLAIIDADSEKLVGKFTCQCEFYYEGSGKTPKYVQWVVCDKAGLLPWQKGFDEEYMGKRQVVMGAPPKPKTVLRVVKNNGVLDA